MRHHQVLARSGARPSASKIFASALLLLACSSEKSDATPACVGSACASSAPPVDWSAGTPSFRAYLRVSDLSGKPVEGASVSVGNLQALTDRDGHAQVGPLSATESAVVRVDKAGMTPQLASTSALLASGSTQRIMLSPLSLSRMVDAEKRVVLQTAGARIELAPRTLATVGGARVSGARAEATYFRAGEHRGTLPGGSRAIDAQGSPTVLEPLAVLYARFRDAQGNVLKLGAGTAAQVRFPLEDGASVADGEEIPLWSLDEEAARWRREGACRVATRADATGTERACVGVIDHLSYWAMGHEIDIYEPNSLGCMNASVRAEEGACFDVTLRSFLAYRCDLAGNGCRAFFPGEERFVPVPPQVSWCGVMPTQAASYRILAVYDVGTDRCTSSPPTRGRRSKVTDPLTFEAFQRVLGSELMLNFSLRGTRDCPTLCTQVPITITRADLDGPVWTDQDNDGALALPAGALRPADLEIDCDDSRPDVRPGPPEPFCIAEDINCDGNRWPASPQVDAKTWNAQCSVCRRMLGDAFTLTPEVRGNAYDEDCDGEALDADGDGVLPPDDCDDLTPSAHAGATEVLGNAIDEDCDGFVIDADADGYYNPQHVPVAKALGLDASRFTDCDDRDPDTNPRTGLANEVGALRPFFYESGGVTRRLPWYCSYFDQSGAPSWLYRMRVRDRNCDKIVTDVDGDGFASPGDLTLGAERATDCDDLDPRNRPVSEDDPTCVVRDDLPNDSTCMVLSRTTAGGCPALTLSGTEIVTTCEEAKLSDGTPTGRGGCTFMGWWEANPLSIHPGSAWGPCDGGGPLAECPAGSSCLGQLAYTSAMSQYLESTYLPPGETLRFFGMCFPSCDLQATARGPVLP